MEKEGDQGNQDNKLSVVIFFIFEFIGVLLPLFISPRRLIFDK